MVIVFKNALRSAMDNFCAARYLQRLEIMAADASEVPILAMVLAGRESLLPPTVRLVWRLDTVASDFSAVTWSSKTSTYAMKAASCSVLVRGASVRLLVYPQEEVRFFVFTCTALLYSFSPASLFWKARRPA